MSAEQIDSLAAAWRYFKFHEIREAEAWAAAGNIAVHHTGMPFRKWKYTCHLFARDEQALRAAARSIGVQLRWIQHPGTPRVHYDIFGVPLARALTLCGVEEERHPRAVFIAHPGDLRTRE